MSRESVEQKKSRVKEILTRLRSTYPDVHCELAFSTPLQLLIATILSAQCTDKRVNIVTRELFRKYKSAADFSRAPIADLEEAVKTTGFFRNKAKNIKACCTALLARHGGDVPRSMEELIQLDGVGRKTANVVLGNAFGINVGVVVDTHVTRLSNRLGLTRQSDAEKIERELMTLVPRESWALFSHWLIWHGRRRCDARRPDCAGCELLSVCPQNGVKTISIKKPGR